VSPLVQTIKAKGDEKDINVEPSDKSCTWTATSPVAWITITRGASGTGKGEVRYQVAKNTGLPRIATLTVAGQSVVITQLGSTPLDDGGDVP
jgi:Putative binding domain, N-terminal